MLLARISLTLSRHFSLSFIASGRSSGLHPVSSHSCCMYVLPGRPAFARPYVGVSRSTSLMSSSQLLQQCPACMVSSALVRQLVLEKEKSEFKPVKLRLKIDLVSYPARAEGLVNMIVFVMGGRWPYSWYFVGCCRQDLFNMARNILF